MAYVAKYDRVTPCAECPFRKGDRAVRLSADRAKEICEFHGQFPCHKTVEYNDDGSGRASNESSACAGAVLFHLNSGNPPLSLRLAVAMGMIDLDKYRDPKLRECVVEGVEEMILGGVR